MKRSLYFIIIRGRDEIEKVIINDAFAYVVAIQLSKENVDNDWDTEPCTINEC